MRGSPEVFSDFKGGVNLEAAPYSLDINQARDTLNVHTSPVGAVVKRFGCNPISSPSVVFTSLFGVRLATPVLLAQGGTKFYKVIASSGTTSELETEVTPTENVHWDFIQAPVKEAKGPIFGVNGTDTNIYWDGTTGKVKKWEGGGVPKGKYIEYHENRVYIAKGSTLYWSEIINPFNFESPKGGSTEVDPEDGQEITGLGKVGPYLLIFKNRKTFLLTDSNNGYYRRISDDMGCASNRSIVSTEAGTFFMTEDSEIVLTNGSSFERLVHRPVEPLLKKLSGTTKPKVCGVHEGDLVYFSVSQGGSVNDTILEYNIVDNSWWIHKIAYSASETGGVNQFVLLDVSSVSKLFGAGANTSVKRVFDMFLEDRYTDVVAFKTEYKTPWLVFGAPHVNKRIREIRVDAYGDFALVSYNSFSSTSSEEDVVYWETTAEEGDWEEETSEKWEESSEELWGGESAISERRYPTIGVGRAWSFNFISETSLPLQIFSYTVAAQMRKD